MTVTTLRTRVIICSAASALVIAASSSWLSAQPPSPQRIAMDPEYPSGGVGGALGFWRTARNSLIHSI